MAILYLRFGAKALQNNFVAELSTHYQNYILYWIYEMSTMFLPKWNSVLTSFLSSRHTGWIFIFLWPTQLLLVHISVCVFPLKECPLWSVVKHGINIEIRNCCDKLLWLVLFSSQTSSSRTILLSPCWTTQMMRSFTGLWFVLYTIQSDSINPNFIIKLIFFLCKGVIMKICLYKMDVQSKLLPSTGMRVTATDVIYCVFVNKNEVLVVHCVL